MQNYAIHRKAGDDAIHVVSGNAEGYNILTMVDAVDAESPLDAAKHYIGEQRGKTLIIDDIEALNDNVSKVSYYWTLSCFVRKKR